MSTHALLKPHARVFTRGDAAAQVGLVREEGIVLRGLSASDLQLLRDLGDGADLARLRRRAGAAGVSRLEQILGVLRGAGLLNEAPVDRTVRAVVEPLPSCSDDARARTAAYALDSDGYDVLATRRSRHVVVHGGGEVARLVARCLHEGGVGRLTTGESGADLHDLALRAGEAAPVDLVVFVAAGAVPFSLADPWLRRGVPHLPVVFDGPRLEVGPLVAGRGPCLRCLDLHRSDRDPHWPAVLAQLEERPGAPARPLAGESGLRHLAAGFVSAYVHAHLDGRCDLTPGLVVSTRLPHPVVSHHRWSAHPRCRCLGSRETLVE